MSTIEELKKAQKIANSLCVEAHRVWELSGNAEDYDKFLSLCKEHAKIDRALLDEIEKFDKAIDWLNETKGKVNV